MKFISVHISTKRIGFTVHHKAALINIIDSNEPVTLVHAYADKKFLFDREIPTDLVDFIDKFFPRQISFFNKTTSTPMRKEMFAFLKAQNGQPYFIGGPDGEGVVEEYEMAEQMGFSIGSLDLSEFMYDGVDKVFFN